MTDPDDRDMLAAEYVLGTLDAAERADVTARLDADVDLSRAVGDWENRLSPLIDSVPEVEPPIGAFAAIAARIFGAAWRRTVGDVGGEVLALRRRVRRWRSAAAGFALLAASLLAWVAVRDIAPVSGTQRFTAVLQRDAGAPAMVVDIDLTERRLTLRPLEAQAPAGRVYQLWMIEPSLGAPRSLGLLPSDGPARESLTPFDASVITGATYAVTVEPPGGSPTGQPTSAPILSGKLTPFRS